MAKKTTATEEWQPEPESTCVQGNGCIHYGGSLESCAILLNCAQANGDYAAARIVGCTQYQERPEDDGSWLQFGNVDAVLLAPEDIPDFPTRPAPTPPADVVAAAEAAATDTAADQTQEPPPPPADSNPEAN